MTNLGIFAILFLADLALLLLARGRAPGTKNRYYAWHKTYGFVRLQLFKAIFIICYLFMQRSFPSVGAFAVGYQMLYGIVVLSLLIDLLRKR